MKLPPGIFGDPTESEIIIQGKKVPALLDTGSTVSTISESYYQEHLSSSIPLNTLDTMLDIECAGGTQLPYTGYIELDIATPGDTNTCQRHVLLVVPDSKYNTQIPVLLGTNILDSMIYHLQEEHGERFLQNAKLTTPWYMTFHCIVLREKQLSKQNNRLAIVKSAEPSKITVPPNGIIDVKGYCDKEIPYRATPSMLHRSTLSSDHQDLDIEPTLIQYRYGQNGPLTVRISNVTTRTITIPTKAVLCEIQPVTIEATPKSETTDAEELLKKVEITKSDLTDEELEIGKNLILSYQDIFSKGDDDVGHTDRVKHRIDLTDDKPFKQRYRRIPPSMYEEVRSHLRQLLDMGIIRPSHSPYSSNVVLVKKKDGSLRLCVDYRQLNKATKKDNYALPRIEDLLDCLGGSDYFSVLDNKSGYYQVSILEEHKERTAFSVGPLGFFEYNRMPFGLTNSPATYQRLMEDCLADLNLKICCIFIDDIIVFGKTYQEHLENLHLVLQRIRDANLKLAAHKCEFFKRRVKYVGHVVSKAGVEIDQQKVEAVVNWPKPTTPEAVRRFLGFVGYYRRFIKDFSRVSRPLTDLMPTPKTTKKTKKSKPTKEWKWGKEQETAFETLKQHLISAPILGYADSSLPYELHTDASGDALGAVLYQEQEGTKRVISYASRSLNKAERNYAPHKREFLALKWAICDKFKDYLYGQRFTVLTDNNPVTYVLTTAKLDATGHRWLAALAAFNFDIRYRPGRSNADADALSRLSEDTSEERIIDVDSIQAICNSVVPQCYVESLTVSPDIVVDDEDPTGNRIGNIVDWSKAQSLDPDLKRLINYVQDNRKPTRDEIGPNPLLRQFNRLQLIDGVLHRVTSVNKETRHQLSTRLTTRSRANSP